MSNETERTLHELKLPGMASCWSSLEETHQLDKLTLREGMQIMLQYERDTRGNNRIQRLIKNAGFRLRASMEELETDTARGIQTCSAADLATGNYITGGMTVIITGPAGTGKSYFACALGDRACRERPEGTVLHDEHAHREPEACTSGRTGNKLLPEAERT